MLYLSRLVLKNWRNFRSLDAQLQTRMFVVGPNASGKSNILDAIRFLRDLTREGGGLHAALDLRGGLSKIRSLFARDPSDVHIECELGDDRQGLTLWRYELVVNQAGGGVQLLRPLVKSERVWKQGRLILERPSVDEAADPRLEEYTHLENPLANREFRDVADFFSSVRYLHLVPQLVRSPGGTPAPQSGEYFGSDFISRAARLNEKTRNSYLRRIEKALRLAVPQFQGLELVTDEQGRPHLQTTFKHWRPQGAHQREDQFSDGTVRLLGFLWALLDGRGPVLLEEPELSLHPAIVKHLAEIIARLQSRPDGRRQVIATTHSAELLSNPGVGGEEIAALYPEDEGTTVRIASSIDEIRTLLESGIPAGEVVIPSTAPAGAEQLLLGLGP